MNETYSELFPTKWHGEMLSADDVELLLCREHVNPQLKTKSALNHPNWTQNKLDKLITTKGKSTDETWRLPKEDQRLLVWQEDLAFSKNPDAIMSFNIEVTETTKSGKPSWIVLTNNLMWVSPEKRQNSFGSHLVAHFLCYLLACKVYYPFVSRKGIRVTYYADFFSEGGERLSRYICSHLEYMSDNWKQFHHKEWPIHSVEIDAGY